MAGAQIRDDCACFATAATAPHRLSSNTSLQDSVKVNIEQHMDQMETSVESDGGSWSDKSAGAGVSERHIQLPEAVKGANHPRPHRTVFQLRGDDTAESIPNIDLPTEGYYYNLSNGIEVEAVTSPTSQKSQDVTGRARAASKLSRNSNWSGQDHWAADQSINSGLPNDRSSPGCISVLTATQQHSGAHLDLGSSTCNPDRHQEACRDCPFIGGSLLAPGCELPQDDWTINTAAGTGNSGKSSQWRPTWGCTGSSVGEMCYPKHHCLLYTSDAADE